MIRIVPILIILAFALTANAQSVSRTELRATNTLIRSTIDSATNILDAVLRAIVNTKLNTNSGTAFNLTLRDGSRSIGGHTNDAQLSPLRHTIVNLGSDSSSSFTNRYTPDFGLGLHEWWTITAGPTFSFGMRDEVNDSAPYSADSTSQRWTMGYDLYAQVGLRLPNSTAPVTDAAGEVALDTNFRGANKGSIQYFDGTSNVIVVAHLATATPTDGQIPKYDSATGYYLPADDDNSGGSGTPGGSDTQVQYNNGGSFGGSPLFTYNDSTGELTVGGGVTSSNGFSSVGSGPGYFTAIATNSNSSTLMAANSNAVIVTNFLGVIHQLAASLLVHDAAFSSEWVVTNRIGAATTILVTNLSLGKNVSGTVLGEASGGASRAVTIIPDSGILVANLNTNGTALAASFSFTLAPGTGGFWAGRVRKLNGSNVLEIASRDFAF